MESKLLKKASYEEEISKLENDYDLEDATTSTSFSRVVWDHKSSIKTHKLGDIDLDPNGAEFPTLRGIHVGDPDFWFKQLVNDYNREPRAWVIDILPVEGDVYIKDPNYTIPPEFGEKGDSYVLITKRTSLKEGVDFDYVRELTEDDLPEEERFEEEEDEGYETGFGGYGSYDEYGDDD